MPTLLEIFDLVNGVPSNAAWDMVKRSWKHVCGKEWEDLYIDSFRLAVNSEREYLISRFETENIEIDLNELKYALHQDLALNISDLSANDLASNPLKKKIGEALSRRRVLLLDGKDLSEDDYAQLVRNLIKHAEGIFKKSIIENETAFREEVLKELSNSDFLLKELTKWLDGKFGLILHEFDLLKEKTKIIESLSEKVEEISNQIEQHLGLDKSEEEIQKEILRSIESWQNGPIFQPDALCYGCPLEPLSDKFSVVCEEEYDRSDLHHVLTKAFGKFDMKPIYADEIYWHCHKLCKISALIQCTPFSIIHLTKNPSPNTYIGMGITIGLNRPFILIKEQGIDTPSLISGLDYFQIDSFIEFRYELSQRVQTFLTQLAIKP